MSRPVFQGAKRLASTAMFGRSNSLSINTGTANNNSTLYASSSSSSSSSFPQNPPAVPGSAGPSRETPVLAFNTNYGNRSTPQPDSQSQWAEPFSPSVYEERAREREAKMSNPDKDPREVGLDEAPWLDKDWKPPPGPEVPTLKDGASRFTYSAPLNNINRPDLSGPGPRKKLTPRSGSQQQTGGSQPQQGGSLFGGGAGATQTSQPQGGNSLFGGSLFGGNQQTQNQQSTQQPATGSLFGNTQQNQNQQEQKPATGGLFGGAQTNQTQQQNTQQPAAGGSMFGASKPAGTGSLFGGAATTGGLFGNSAAQQPQQPASNSLFGGGLNQTQNQPQQQQQQPNQASLLGVSRYNQSQYQPFVTGRLTMGQGQGGAPQPTAKPATKLDWSNVRNTTRFNDLTDEAKRDIEQIDALIAKQEEYCKSIEAFLPNHQTLLQTLGPDVRVITEKLDEVDQSLAVDAQGVQQDKNITEKDEIDIDRCIRIVDNLRMPAQYIYHPAANSGRQPQAPAWDETYDVDLVGNYFQPLTQDMARLLATYSGNLTEIENHMGTIEQSAVAQAHQLNAQRSGLGGQRDVGADSVRQLADTLRGFEASILAAAGRVGECREGVNELVLGRLGASQASRRAW
jgi:nucleoporin p58/p45